MISTANLFLIGLALVLLVTGLGALFWRRIYRDDAQNIARRVFKNSAVPFAMRLIVRALDMAFLIILIRTLPEAEVGAYFLATMLVGQYLSTITEFGLGVLLTREVAQDPNAAPRLFGITLLLRWLVVLLAAVPSAALLIALYALLGRTGLTETLDPASQAAIWILLLTLIPSAYSGAVTALYNAAERMEVPALLEVVTAVLSLVARLAVLWLGFGIVGLAWAAVGVTSTTALIYLFLQTRSFFRPTLRWDRTLMRRLISPALPLMLNNLLSVMFFTSDLFIIKAFGAGQGDVLVAQYRVAYNILNIAMILPPVVTFAVFPLLARHAAGERAVMRQAQNRTLQALLLPAFPLAMGISLLAPDLIRLFSGEQASEYLPVSARVLSLLAWFLPLSFVNGLLQYVLIAVNRQAAITRAFIIGATCNIVTNLIVIPVAVVVLMRPQVGLYAAAGTTILSEIVLLAIFLPLLRREGLTPPLPALAWRPAVAALLMGAAMGGVLFLVGAWDWLVAGLIAAPVYGVALWLLGAFGAEERALALRIFGRV